MDAVYLDNNASTPLDPRVAEAMLPWLGERHGNPSSLHRFGQEAREAVEGARAEVAELLGAQPPEIVFTSSGTEANNTVLTAVGNRWQCSGHLVVSAVEHASVRRPVERLEAAGMRVTWVAPTGDGAVLAEAAVAALEEDTRLVCLMLANNEVGTLQPVARVARACRERAVPVLSDAAQAVGKVAVQVEELGVDYLTLGAHKFHGPLGAGALWVRDGAELASLMEGGNQERRRRASTENVPALVGFGRAAALAREELAERGPRLAALRDRLEAGLPAIPGACVHGTGAARLPNTCHVAFAGLEGESLLIRLDLAGFAVSTGSACSSGVVEPSKTLLAMGLTPEESLASIRVSVGITNTAAEVDAFLAALEREVSALRRAAPAALA